MFLDFDENRPETPRVVPALTRLERVLLAVVAYQLILLAYLFAPDSWVQPVKRLVVDDPIRFVQIQPLVDRTAVPKKAAPPSVTDRPAASPQPAPAKDQPAGKANTPEQIVPTPAEQRAAETPPRVTGPSPNEAPLVARRVPGGILGSARKGLDRYAPSSGNNNPAAEIDEQGPAIQFDSRGVDFGPWLRRFRAQVIRNWFIPQTADVMRGHVVIQMRVLRSGALANIHVVRSSGIDPFDRAAMTALRLSTPTLPLPDNYPLDAIDPFTVIFYYNEPIR